MKNKKYPNIHYDKHSLYPFQELNESVYIEAVLDHLVEIFGSKFSRYEFIVYSNHGPANPPPESMNCHSPKKKVLLYFSDEHGVDPSPFSGSYHAIFKSYIGTAKEASNIFPLPLGLVKDVPSYPVIPINERKINVFFSGNLNLNRVTLYKSLTSLGRLFPERILSSALGIEFLVKIKRDFSKRFPDSLILFNNGFKSGLTPSTYGETLSQSKVILCPRGYFSTECFRHYEALRAGCVIISERLPDNHLYKNSPIIQVDNWNDGLRQADKLLADKEKLNQLSQHGLDWWENVFSEKAAANYVADRLKTLL